MEHVRVGDDDWPALLMADLIGPGVSPSYVAAETPRPAAADSSASSATWSCPSALVGNRNRRGRPDRPRWPGAWGSRSTASCPRRLASRPPRHARRAPPPRPRPGGCTAGRSRARRGPRRCAGPASPAGARRRPRAPASPRDGRPRVRAMAPQAGRAGQWPYRAARRFASGLPAISNGCTISGWLLRTVLRVRATLCGTPRRV